MSKIVLGTVQFGVNYGINNPSGKVSLEEVCNILHVAVQGGITTLDTSSAYGTSEVVLGKALRGSSIKFNIVSKYPKSDKGVRDTFAQSLQNLGVTSLYGYLVHHFEFYEEHPEIFEEMTALKKDGKIEKVGFSLYNVEQLQYLIDKEVKFDILQFPYNIFDRQFERYMPHLADMGVEIHTRSAFLQGLFFKDTNTLPDKLLPMKRYLDLLHSYCDVHDLTIEQLAFGYVLANQHVKGALIGVDNHTQLETNIEVAGKQLSKEDLDFIQSLDIKEKKLLNPVNWK